MSPGFALVLGVRVTQKNALVHFLESLDVSHARDGSFVLESGGVYVFLEDLHQHHPPPFEKPVPKVDCSLPRGLHTLWHDCLSERPLLLGEANHTLMLTHSVLGAIGLFLEGRTFSHAAYTPEEAQRLPPTLRALLTWIPCLQGDPRSLRHGRRQVRTVVFRSDLFETPIRNDAVVESTIPSSDHV